MLLYASTMYFMQRKQFPLLSLAEIAAKRNQILPGKLCMSEPNKISKCVRPLLNAGKRTATLHASLNRKFTSIEVII